MFERESAAVPVVASRSFRNMPVDFTSYLLSASPPSFDFYGLRDSINADLGYGRTRTTDHVTVINSSISSSGSATVRKTHSMDSFKDLDHHMSAMSLSVNPPKGMGKKKVSFADELGLALTHIKIILEPSDQPPRIRSDILAKLTQGAAAEASHDCPLVLKFKQPASDYVAFREKLNRDFVSLENVVLKDYSLIGTVKVKNIAFEKSVRVRFTSDSWETSRDIQCRYMPTAGTSDLDTFAFELSIPPDFDPSKKVEFCVCYETASQQFWDSNEGANYGVVPATLECDKQPEKVNDIFSLNGFNRDWAEYSTWSCVDAGVPYW